MPRDVRSYLIEGLWQYLLQTEVALAALEDARARPAGIPSDSPEWKLQQYCEDPKLGINEDFAVRLERMVDHLESLEIEGESVEASRQALLSALYSGPIAVLRRLLGNVLKNRNRVAVLIDNLDRGWDRATDVAELSELFLGLIVSSQRLQREFSKQRPGKERIELTLAIFLRSDIFFQLKQQAREPDKLPATRLTWSNPELLLRVLDERFTVSQGGERTPEEVWRLFFPPRVRGLPTQQYLLGRVLPRPRDLLHLCTDAIQAAIAAGHDRVLERDVLEGEKAYSSFACDALRVEGADSVRQLEDILYGFAGASAIQTYPEVVRLLNRAGVPDDEAATVVEHLKTLSFLGVEVEPGGFRYAEDPEDSKRIAAMAQRYGEAGHAGRLEVHPAFRAYLEIIE
jgi:hypothetical protein